MRKREYTEATRAAIVAAARELFAERGYAAVSTEEIVRSARLTRGALYYHFRNKRDLFRALFEEVDRELVDTVAATIAGLEDPWQRLTTGWQTFLDSCVTDRSMRRILFVEAPAVLGWSEYRDLDTSLALGLVARALQDVIDAGLVAPQPVRPLAHLLLGALNEAGMLIANADDVTSTRAEVADALGWLVGRLRECQD